MFCFQLVRLVFSASLLAAADPEPDLQDVLKRMEKANATLSSFTVDSTSVVRLPRKDGPPYMTCHRELTTANDRFRVLETVTEADGKQNTSESAFNGRVCVTYLPQSKHARVRKKPAFRDTQIADPKHLAYTENSGTSRIQELRDLASEDKVSVRRVDYDGRRCILIETALDSKYKRGYKMWIDPAVGFLPIQIEEYVGPHLYHRFRSIVNKQLSEEVWFPISCVFEEYLYLGADTGRLNRIGFYDVEPSSIKLNPELTADSFELKLPAGTVAYESTTNTKHVITGPDDHFLDEIAAKLVQANRPASAPADKSSSRSSP